MQLEFFDVPSPCIGICQADNRGYCLGCLRTRDERQIWRDYSNDQKQKVIKLCQQRRKRQIKRTAAAQGLPQLVKKPLVDLIDANKNRQLPLIVLENNVKSSESDDMDFSDVEL